MARSAKAAKKQVQTVLLTQTAEVKGVTLPLEDDGSLSLKSIQAALKKKTPPEMLGSYKYKSQGLFLFGYLAGKAGQENKHELPPPHDSTLAFGDILLVVSKDAKNWKCPVPFQVDDYETFYTKAFGGFEDLDDEEDEDDVVEEEEVVEEEVEEPLEEAEEVEEEKDEESEEDDSESEAQEGDAEEESEVPTPKKRAVAAVRNTIVNRTKKPKRGAAAAASAAQVYATYLYVPKDKELPFETFDSEDFQEQAATPKRKNMLHALKRLFDGLLSTEKEVQLLERCIYTAALRAADQRHIGKIWSHKPFVDIYEATAKHIVANLHPRCYVENTELFDRYKAGYVTFEDISRMDPYQMFETRWHDSFVAQQMREKRQLEGNKAMATDRFLCGRCHKRECTYYEMQTRSADEPMTIFITCLNCGKHWRQ
jgi:DNA-directed RNA polymerase subunit M/transcription elongation factor TFIIS